mmetsp:Transcript_4232/g.9549  ORF Transcript_4232/g.9549 Transcript_4232/m.9549 type:complete len:349 (-) Transcript_4232:12169-13215(-)
MGYGLSPLFLVIIIMYYAPPSCKDYQRDRFLGNNIDEKSCCSSLFLTGLVTCMLRDAGLVDSSIIDDLKRHVKESVCFIDRLPFVANSNGSKEYVKEIPIFVNQLELVCTMDAGLVMHNIAVMNAFLQVTYQNVFHNKTPTVVLVGAPSREELGEKEYMLHPCATDECLQLGSFIHPQCMMTKKFVMCISAADQARLSFTLHLLYSILIPTAIRCEQVEKWSGRIVMTADEIEAHDEFLFYNRWLGGTLCWIGECGIFDKEHPMLLAAGVDNWGAFAKKMETAIFDKMHPKLLAKGVNNWGAIYGPIYGPIQGPLDAENKTGICNKENRMLSATAYSKKWNAKFVSTY